MFVILAVVILAVLPECVARTITLTVKKEFRAPDCVDRLVVTTNGQFPAPEIRVQPGEALEVIVENQMINTAVSIHWHGQNQKGTPWQDGGSMISSCPIPPMSSWVYNFHVNSRPGTYQYHAHVGGVRQAGMGGSLIIEGDISRYTANSNGEFVLNAMDWWHATSEELSSMVTGQGTQRRWLGGPQSILVNGKGYFNCTDNGVEAPWHRPGYHPQICHDELCPGYETLEVDSGKTYLLRFIHGGSLSHMNIAIEGHNMTVVEVDGMPTEPYVTSTVDFNSGQRVSVLVTTDKPPNIYTIRFKFRNDQWSSTLGHALLKYSSSTKSVGDVDPTKTSIDQPEWDNNQFTFDFQNAIQGLYDGPGKLDQVPGNEQVQRRFVMTVTNEMFADHEISNIPLSSVSLDNVQTQIGEGGDRPEMYCDAGEFKYDRWALARRTFMHPKTPVLSKLYFDIGAADLNEETGYYSVELGEVYDIVIQNYPACYNVCEVHSWHLHGMHFWVLGTFRGEWTGSSDQIAAFNMASPPVRDTVMTVGEGIGNIPENKAGCGYTVIRFIPESPGVWPFHCHHVVDNMAGAGALFYTKASSIPAPPSNLMLCGNMTVHNVAQKLFPSTPMTCGGVKAKYKDNDCCGNPNKPFDSSLLRRRLADP